MKKFKFRLERVLDFRNAEKKDRERELALKNQELKQREERLSGILEAQEKTRLHQESVMTMAELALTGGYQKFLRKMLEEQRMLVQEAIHAVDMARDAYIEKAVESETLQTLKEHKLEEYGLEKKREERKGLDNIVVQRFASMKRKVGGGSDNGE